MLHGIFRKTVPDEENAQFRVAARASSAPTPAAAPNPAPARAIQLKNIRLFFNIGNSLTFC